jgi:pimeloyl-ACP methyl ester carboxylesterase
MSTVTSSDGTSIAYQRDGAGPALILVDAACGFRGFGPMGRLARLLAADFTVYTYDRRGRGDSTDTPPYSVDREIDDLRAVVDAAGGSAFGYGFSSGAVLVMLAAARGLPITKLGLMEPPLALDDQPPAESDLRAELAELIAAGRRGDAVEHFHRSIGVPAELVAGLRQSPGWPALESVAPTLVYDTTIASSVPVLSAIVAPTLVIDSEGSDGRLRAWARGVADHLPNARHRSMKGEWHGVPDEDLARALTEFFAEN